MHLLYEASCLVVKERVCQGAERSTGRIESTDVVVGREVIAGIGGAIDRPIWSAVDERSGRRHRGRIADVEC